MDRPNPGIPADEQTSPAFVELVSGLPAGLPECTIEMEQPSGAKMMISLHGGVHGAELLALIASLYKARR